MPTRPRRLDDERREALHPPVDGDVVDVDAAFGKQLLHVAVRQAATQVPTHRQQDHARREPVPNERRRLAKAVTAKHHGTLRPHPISQHNRAITPPSLADTRKLLAAADDHDVELAAEGSLFGRWAERRFARRGC